MFGVSQVPRVPQVPRFWAPGADASKCPVPHPFAFFLAKGWDTNTAGKIAAEPHGTLFQRIKLFVTFSRTKGLPVNLSLTLPVHAIPLWFLVLSLFLPRICILVAWLQHSMPVFIPPTVGILSIIVAVLIPRILILFWIYTDQGISLWFVLHAIALLIAWGGSSHTVYRRSN